MHNVRKIEEENKELAKGALNKPAPAGQDIDLTQYVNADNTAEITDLSQLTSLDKEQMLAAGIILDGSDQRSGEPHSGS